MNVNKIKLWTNVGAYLLASTTAAIASPTLLTAGSIDGDRPISTEAIVTPAGGQNFRFLAQGGEGDNAPAFQDKLSGAALVKALQQGGYIIYFRHAQTEKDYADQISAKMGDCSTQRMLSETGWQQAKSIGQGFRNLKIPVGEVYSSEYCRAWQTADLAFGRHQKTAALNFAPAEEYTEAQVKQMRDAVMPMLTRVPAAGANTVIVGHDDVFESATGIYPEPQGVAYILKPDGRGGFEILANITAEEWMNLPK
jgi:phosphohistidine phosphatase SixA